MRDSNLLRRWQSAAPYFQSALRIFAGLLLVATGSVILFGFPVKPPSAGPVPDLIRMQTQLGGILQTFGGLLFALGLFTRPVAFVLSGMMAVAYFQFHFKAEWPAGIMPNLNNGMPSGVLCFVFLFFSAAGGGKWSLDAARENSQIGVR